MMNPQQPDNFFRDKLQNYQKPAPQGAWNKIESALEKKTAHKFVWWKVAAVLFLMAGAASVLWFNNTDVYERPLAQVEEQPTGVREKIEQVRPEEPVEKQINATAATNEPEDIRPLQSEKGVRNPIDEKAKSHGTKKSEPAPSQGEQLMPELQSLETVTPTVDHLEIPAAKSPITITFSAEETSQYLNKNALAEATFNKKKPSSLKKFVKKANDLKSNQDLFGDLRERKNEILALNFKNDKREQNK